MIEITVIEITVIEITVIEIIFCFSSCSPNRLAVAPPAVLAAFPDSSAASALPALDLDAPL